MRSMSLQRRSRRDMRRRCTFCGPGKGRSGSSLVGELIAFPTLSSCRVHSCHRHLLISLAPCVAMNLPVSSLRNTKPSAIFRLRGHAVPSSSASSAGTSSGFGALSATSAPTSVTAALGISIEPDTVVDAQISALRATPEQAMMIEGPAAASASANSMAGPATQDPQSRANFALELAPKIGKCRSPLFGHLYVCVSDR